MTLWNGTGKALLCSNMLLRCFSLPQGICDLFSTSLQSVACHLARLTLLRSEFTRLWATLLSGEYASVSS